MSDATPNINDQTWTRIVFVNRDTPHSPTYFRFQEHGGLTKYPLEADRNMQFNASMATTVALMEKDCPQMTFMPERLVVKVLPFEASLLPMLLKRVHDDVRQQALRKLSDIEIEALGITP